jgi:hypothetical protein
MDEQLRAWRAAGKHLPEILRDFHDQKDFFKAMHTLIGEQSSEESPLIRRPTWVEGQCYVIDCFLWFMARHGYTLQRSRASHNFDSLEKNIALVQEYERQQFARMLENSGNGSSTKPSAQD